MINEPPPPLREELKQRTIKQQGELIHIIKEPDKSAYYRFDEGQYLMLTLFDGRRTPLQLVKLFNETSEEYEYDHEVLEELIASARNFQILKRNPKEAKAALLEKIKSQRQGMNLQMQGSLMHMRFQLVDPGRWFDRVIDRVRFVFSPTGVFVSLLIIALAFMLVFTQADRFYKELDDLAYFLKASPIGLLGLWIIALSAIALHEVAHGLSCRNFGGEVNEMGVLFMAFQPCLYCNVNDAWLFEKTSHKIYVALAGVWIEMFLGALAAFIWILAEPGSTVGTFCFILMLIATATSLFMNLNPLMKFDGYYILSDLLEAPNLRENSISWFSYSLKSKLFRHTLDAPFQPTRRESTIYLTYGGLTTLYLGSMLSGLAVMLHGPISNAFGTLGVIVYFYLLVKVAFMLLNTWPKFIKDWFIMVFLGTTLKKFLMVLLLISVGIALFRIHLPINILSEGKVEVDRLDIHATENGFVRSVAYQNDRTLTSQVGEPLIVMESPQLDLEQSQTRASLEGLQLDQRRALSLGDRNLLQRTGIQTQSEGKNLTSIEQRIARLFIPTPPGSWQVDGPPPMVINGRYFQKGETLITLIPQHKRRMNVTLEQSDLSFIQVGLKAYIRLFGSGTQILTGQVQSIAPVAKSEGAVRLFDVRINLNIPIDSLPPHLGMKGEIRILGEEYPLWKHLLRPIRKTFRADLWL